ncbi:MAG: TolC family protein [Williamsia sp.]|nr:TolC family protein [Williamsia sp.]
MKLLRGLLFCLLLTKTAASQSLSLQAFETQFLKNNFTLIAEQFNIDASKAAITQARLWENPFFSAEFNAFHPQPARFFDAGRGGEKALAIQQLIYLGGKKKKEVELARTNAAAAELAFWDVLRNLRFQLRSGFFDVYYTTLSAAALGKQLNNLDTLVQAYNLQAQKGNISLKDVVRLQALYLDLRNEHTSLLNSIAEEQNKLNVLVGMLSPFLPAPDEKELTAYDKPLPLSVEGLLTTALSNRPDYLLAEKTGEAARRNLQWQRSLAVPDLSLGASYDQRGGAFNNQVNLTVGIPVRLWNRNQGNIRIAAIRINQTATEKELLSLQVKSDVTTAYRKYGIASSNYAALRADTYKNFEIVYQGVYQNFQKRNISIIEFTDFMESYYKSIIRFNETKNLLIQSSEQINYATGTTIF